MPARTSWVAQRVGPEPRVAAAAGSGAGPIDESGLLTEVGDDGASGAVGEAGAVAAVEQQRRARVGTSAGGTFVEPVLQRGAQLGPGQGELAQFPAVAAFPAHGEHALAGRQGDIVDVEADDLADAQAGVEGQQRDDGVAGAAVVLNRAGTARPPDR